MADKETDFDEKLTLAAGPYITSLRVPPKLLDSVRSTLQDLLIDDNRATTNATSVEIEPEGTYRILADGRTYRSGIKARLVPDALVRMLLLAELDDHPERLHLHAGAVADNDRGVIIAGFSGDGKSTLVTSLVQGGFDYLTDERVAIDADSLIVSSFPKPISLVHGSFAVFPELRPAVLGHGQGDHIVWQIPASAFGSGKVLTELCAEMIIFVNYVAGSDATVAPVHPVTAVARLLHDSPDIARFGAEALRVCAALCTSALCVELTYSQPTEVAPVVRALLDETAGEIPPTDVTIFDADGCPPIDADLHQLAGTDHLSRTSTHTILVIDGRSLVHVEDNQELIELDEGATAWLMLVDGVSTVDELVDAVHIETGISRRDLEPGALRALSELSRLGLVCRPT